MAEETQTQSKSSAICFGGLNGLLLFSISVCCLLLMSCIKIHEIQPRVKEQIVLPEAKRGEKDIITIYDQTEV